MRVKFTKYVENPDRKINCNRFYPRIPLNTAGSIGDGLDSVDVYCVIFVGFPTSTTDMVQEIS